MKPHRPLVARVALPITLAAVLLLSSPLIGCSGKPTPSPTPTKTPTPPSVATSTPMVRIAMQTLPTYTPLPTPTATNTPTTTPTPTPTKKVQEATTTPTPAEAATTTPTAEAEKGSENKTNNPTPVPTVAAGSEINPLTGLQVPAWKLNRRPLGIKIPNFPFEARPQSGLSRADVVIEHEAEAYLTRFTAIFMGNDANPLVGPIRSLRLPDAELMSIFKATLVASGGHPSVKIRITQGKAWAAGYKRIICPEEPFLGDGGATRRVAKSGRRYELTLYSDTASLWNVSTQRGINGRQDFHNMWTFSDTPPGGGAGATHLKIVYKPTYSIAEYRYDAGTKTYKRFDVGQPSIDELTGQQIAPSNVLVLYANHVNSDIAADTHDPNNIWYAVIIQLWGEGQGKLLRDGKVYDIRWVRENAQQSNDRLIFVDGSGNQIPLRPGSTWIQLVRPDADVLIE